MTFSISFGDVRRSVEGRLFTPLRMQSCEGEEWTISAQGAKAGYDCLPRADLPRLGDYQEVEVCISSPWGVAPSLGSLGLPEALAAKFPAGDPGTPVIGRLTLAELGQLAGAMLTAVASNPNAGYPKGTHLWPGRQVFHGTDIEAAEDIARNGINLDMSTKGYFGQAFYMAEDCELAQSNYADAHGGDGAVISARIVEGARILDLRNADDHRAWLAIAEHRGSDGFAALARRAGVDGVHDRSFGGIAIYNARVLEDIEIHSIPDAPTP